MLIAEDTINCSRLLAINLFPFVSEHRRRLVVELNRTTKQQQQQQQQHEASSVPLICLGGPNPAGRRIWRAILFRPDGQLFNPN